MTGRKDAGRILIFRLGSIGDFVVALPCLHAIRDHFPNAEIALLTNVPFEQRASSAMTVLEHTGLIDKVLSYPVPLQAREVKKLIRTFSPDVLVYLAERHSMLSVYRDYAFFLWCGIRKLIGVPIHPAKLMARPVNSERTLWEPEAARLARCLTQQLGEIDVHDSKNWDLHLTEEECNLARQVLCGGFKDDFGRRPLIGVSIGTKHPINDWGIANWRVLVETLKDLQVGLVLIGSKHERALSDQLAELWPSRSLNLCGLLSPRVSAAVARHLSLLLCHDSGPMHLASAVGTPCIAIFSQKNPPGKWFPFGAHNKVFYPSKAGHTIQSITPPEVSAAVRAVATSFVTPGHVIRQTT